MTEMPQPPPFPKVIGHRGAAGLAPENTLAGIRRAAELGVGWVEVDVMLCRDGEAVLIHDEHLERTTDGTGRVVEHDLAALRQLDAGRWFGAAFAGERIPTLNEAIRLIAALGLGVNLEIKPSAGFERTTGATVAGIADRDRPRDLPPPLLSSFSATALAAAREVAPDLPRALIVRRVPRDWRAALERLGCAGLHCNHRRLTPELARAVREAGYHLLCYTVNEPERARELYGWGVEAVFSDYPDRLLAM